MKFSLPQLLFGSIFLVQVTSIAGLAIPSQDGLAVRSEQLNARTAGLGDKLKKLISKKKPNTTPAAGPLNPAPKNDEPESSTKPGPSSSSKTFPDWTILYKPRPDDNKGPTGLEPAVAAWLEGPLGKSVAGQKFTSFSVASKRKHNEPVDHAVFKARYSSEGMLLDSMYKKVDMNAEKDQIPTAEFMDIGAKKLNSMPKWIFTKKVANTATREILLSGLQEKYGKGQIVDKTWTISSTSTDPIDRKYFDKIMASDNGKPVVQWCRFHPECVHGSVSSIVVKGDDHSKLLFILGGE